MAGHLDALVLDLDTRAGLAIARTLGRQGLRVAIGARDPSASGMRTRYAAGRVALPRPEADFSAYADAIVEAVREHPVDAVVASIDSSVMALHRRRGSVPGAIGSEPAVEIAVSKPRTLELAERLTIPTPRSVRVATADEVDAAARELGFPVVVKPDESWRDEGVGGERLSPLLVTGAHELPAARRLVPALVQELAPGVRETIKLFRVDGETVARFAMRVDRCWPSLGGSSVFRESILPPADALAHGEALVDAIGLDGYSEVEFRRSRDGRPLLMEVNPRLSQSVELAILAGVDFARMQLEWARGGRVAPVEGYRVGVRLGWLGGDVRLRGRHASDYLGRRTHVDGFALDDPLPALGSVAVVLRHLGTRSRGGSPG